MYPQGIGLLTNDCVECQQVNCKYKCHALLNMTVTNDTPPLVKDDAPCQQNCNCLTAIEV
jgi:hypothetical protein